MREISDTEQRTQAVMLQKWYVPASVFRAGPAVYAGPDPNSAPLVCDCSAITDLDLWDGDPYVLAWHIGMCHNEWLNTLSKEDLDGSSPRE